MTLIDILLIILILSASVLCIFAIIYLKRITENVEAVTKDVHEFVETASPVIEKLGDATNKVNRIVSEVEYYWDEIDISIKKIRERISGLTSLKNYRDVEYPAKDLIKNIKAFTKGASAFWNAFKRR
ncbi:MAG: hypothetical protein NTX65_15380 [Ignavibacteriales bacterium]|nr:hypothetical protein [Ignavibacteriales bacterium]